MFEYKATDWRYIMANKKICFGILVMVLVFEMTIIGYGTYTFTRKFEQNIMETELDIRKKKEKKEWVNRINRFRELEERAKALVESCVYHDLLYRYEPYYIHEGWNYTEKYTPEIK